MGSEIRVIIRLEIHQNCFMHPRGDLALLIVHKIEERIFTRVDLNFPGFRRFVYYSQVL